MNRSTEPRCEFAGDENTKNGVLVPCTEPGRWVMRLRGLEGIHMGKRIVCERHQQLLVSTKVRATGRDWAIDHHVRDRRTKEQHP